jgi:molybdopterin-guanine dinucleotide biosynthesis protein B
LQKLKVRNLLNLNKKNAIAVAFTGPSNSGKTTLIKKLADYIINTKKQKVVIIKNDPKDKAIFDVAGKDSDIFFKTGADVFVTSPTRTTFFSHQYSAIDEIISKANDFDFLLVEGLKDLPLPRIGIFRNKINEDYLEVINSLAIDDSIQLEEYQIPENISILNLNDEVEVFKWITQNGKQI